MKELLDRLEDREQRNDAFRLAETAFCEGRSESYSEEMSAFDMAHGEVLDWLSEPDHLAELLEFLRAHPTSDKP